jgi:hypothetical protein
MTHSLPQRQLQKASNALVSAQARSFDSWWREDRVLAQVSEQKKQRGSADRMLSKVPFREKIRKTEEKRAKRNDDAPLAERRTVQGKESRDAS